MLTEMKRLKWISIGLALFSFSCGQAFAWAREGHAAIAAIAEHLISPTTRTKVNDLLSVAGDQDLVFVASWADEVILAAHDEGPLRGNQEAIEFNRKFPQSWRWHFVNLPLASQSYEQVRRFATSDDVVHAISRCIRTLESSEAISEGLSKIQALRLLVHFVGDIHQPLHCGTGFYNFSASNTPELISDPKLAFGHPNDRGGNLLYYGPNELLQLHAFWDRILVEEVSNTSDYHGLTAFLESHYALKEIPRTAGDYHQWAETWAIESAQSAASAYQGITFGTPEFDSDHRLTRIKIALPPGYADSNKPRAARQLVLAGVRLAQLLDSIIRPAGAQ